MFSEIEMPTTLANSVEHSILSYIRKKELNPGDLLPKEAEIASGLNVSRNVVREGISGLKALGLIESRKRRGMILCHPNAFEGVRKLAKERYFSNEECSQFMQIRAIMELGMVNLIWGNRTAENLKELRKFAGVRGKFPSIEEEIAFHCKLFGMGGNFVADQFLKILSTAFETLKPSTEEEWKGNPTHADICRALENGTKDEFYKIMEKHFKPYLHITAKKGNGK